MKHYVNNKFEDGIVGLELETEFVQIGDLFCSIFNIVSNEGGVLAISSVDKFLINRLTNQLERLVASIEKISN